MLNYKLAVEQNINQLVTLAAEHDAEHQSKPCWVPFDLDHVRDVLARMITSHDCLVVVAFDGAKIYGAVGAHLSHHVLNRDKGLVLELFRWINVNARGNGIGSGFLAGLQKWARLKGAARLIISSMDADQDTVERFEEHGFMPSEMVWVQDMTTPKTDNKSVTMHRHQPCKYLLPPCPSATVH